MISDLTFNNICDMVLTERVARFKYIPMTPEDREAILNDLSEKDKEFYNEVIPTKVKNPQKRPEAVQMYKDVFLNILNTLKNMPQDPDDREVQVNGLRLNDLFATSVSPKYKVIKLQMNQFRNFMNAVSKNTDSVKWNPHAELFVDGKNEDILNPDSVEDSPIGGERPGSITDDTKDEGPVGDLDKVKFDPNKKEHIPELGDDDYWDSIGFGNSGRLYKMKDGADEVEDNYRHTIKHDRDFEAQGEDYY